ncbi:MAG: response regulator [Bdellovibrionales bacterium]|nr:response regulator [Bdellovibrionales bacterium]
MGKVLVIDNNADFREIITRKIDRMFEVEVIATGFFPDIQLCLQDEDLRLVVSDVQDSGDPGFWVHNFLLKTRPNLPLALFIDEYRMLRNIPQKDSTARVFVLKPNFQKLCDEIEKLGVLDVRSSH